MKISMDKIQILNISIDVLHIIYFFLIIVIILFWILIIIFIFNIFKNIKNKNKIKSLLMNDKKLQKNIKDFNIGIKQIKEFMKNK